MCGIAGIFRRSGATPEDTHQVGEMLRALQHRGPDGMGLQHLGQAVLGHARLAIIDLATGDQPIADTSGSIRVVVNGEIYNFQELRAQLQDQGCVFRTDSDIEVVPHLYRVHGDDFVTHLHGMFALALHDGELGRLILARDRLGQKPLYHTTTGDGLAWASEAQALLALPDVGTSPDLEALDLYLTYQYIPAPWSAFRDVRKLKAGTLVIHEADGRVVERTYWDPLPGPDDSLTVESVNSGLHDLLGTASSLRLKSDVPVGVFLSGGIDSGLVTSYLAAGSSDPMQAITVGFPGAAEDERHLARITARALGVELEEEVAQFDLPNLVNQVVAHLDEPLGDSSCIPTWALCRAAACRFKVVISGDGGDESFAGYADRYHQNLVVDQTRRWLPGVLRKSLAGSLAGLWPKGDRLPRAFRWKRVLRSLSLEALGAYFLDMSIFRPSMKMQLYRPGFTAALGSFQASALIEEPFLRTEGTDLLSRLLYVDRRTWLGEGVLAKVDRMSMAHSLEVRSPLLDHRVVEFAGRVPSSLKLAGSTGKVCLRELARRRLPAAVTAAPKAGFAPPLGSWLRGPLFEMVQETLFGSSTWIGDLIETDALQTMWNQHQSGRRDHSRPLWLLFVLERWAQGQHVGSAG